MYCPGQPGARRHLLRPRLRALRRAGVWRLLGRLSDQQKGLVEERLKSVDKDLAKKRLAPGWVLVSNVLCQFTRGRGRPWRAHQCERCRTARPTSGLGSDARARQGSAFGNTCGDAGSTHSPPAGTWPPSTRPPRQCQPRRRRRPRWRPPAAPRRERATARESIRACLVHDRIHLWSNKLACLLSRGLLKRVLCCGC